MAWTSTPTSSRTDANFGDSSPMFAFSELQQQLGSMEEQDEDDKYWNTSRLGGFNFEEDGPSMFVSQRPKVERPRKLEFVPTIEKEAPKFVTSLVTAGLNTPKQTAEQIFLGSAYNVEQFRSLEAKIELLEAALAIGDTSTVQVVVLFLRHTLKASLFQREIQCRPVALKAFLSYLREAGNDVGVLEQLTLSGHKHDAGWYRHSVISKIEDHNAKARALEASLATDLVGHQAYSLLQDELQLLKLQGKIEEIDALTLEIKDPLIGSSLVETVRYCAKYHANDPETHFASPSFLRQNFKLCPEQFSYACISAFAETQNYSAIESLLESKSWLGKKKLSSPIGFDRIVLVLYQHKAPVDLLEKYITYVDDLEQRIELSKKVGAMTSLVNCFVQTKNRSELANLLAKLPRESTAALLAHSVLNNPAIKWKS